MSKNLTKEIVAKSNGQPGKHVTIDIPNSCPHCHVIMIPNQEFIGVMQSAEEGFPMLYRCTNPECREYFAVNMMIDFSTISGGYKAAIKPYTYTPKPIYDLSDEIDVISPMFREIYSQAQIAESYGLDQIAGVGFRKSVEFLVKDYLKHEGINGPKGKNIEECLLGVAIKQIPNEKIKSLATAATWLGNDETHYVKKFDSYDITSMKAFIKALSYEVSSVVATEEAISLIESKGSKTPIS